MRIWLINPHELIPVPENKGQRLMRMGAIAHVAASQGHEVVWWTSTFSHVKKTYYARKFTSIKPYRGLELRLMHARGYRRNVSVGRLRYLSSLAKQFAVKARQDSSVPDVILASYPPVELAYEAVMFGRERGIPVVVDLRDMWPDALIRLAPPWLQPIASMALGRMTRKAQVAIRQATSVTAITDAFLEWGLRLARRTRSDLDQTFPFSYVPIPIPSDEIQRAQEKWDTYGIRHNDGVFTVCFIGSVGRHFEGLQAVVQASRILHQRGRMVRFVICGTGERLRHLREMAAGDKDIMFPGWINQAEIAVLLNRSDAGLDPMPETVDFVSTINNKAVEYLSAGLPLIVSPKRGVLYDLVRQHQCGVAFAPNNGEELADAIECMVSCPELHRVMSENARTLYEQKFSPDKVYADILVHLERVARSLGSNSGRRRGDGCSV